MLPGKLECVVFYLFIFYQWFLRKKKYSLRLSMSYFKSWLNSVFWQCVRGSSCTLGALRNVPLSFQSDWKMYVSCRLNKCLIFRWPFSLYSAFEWAVHHGVLGLHTYSWFLVCIGDVAHDLSKVENWIYSIFRWFSAPQTLPQQRTENTEGICILWRQWDWRVPWGTEVWRQLARAGEVVMEG